jgi:hypothetical protein
LNAEATPVQRGPYRKRTAQLSYEQRLALRKVPRPECKCGCGTLTRWLSGKGRWAVYVDGHYRQNAPYKDADWLRAEYIDHRRTTHEIAAQFGVAHSTILKAMRRAGIAGRDRSESRMGRRVGPANPAWKGGVSEWPYSPDWQALARKIRDRDEWTCQRCGERRKRWGAALHVHHINENKLDNDPANLISLCAACHWEAHKGVMT